MKKCTICHEAKSDSEFRIKRSHNRKNRLYSQCKICERYQASLWNKAKWKDKIKQKITCSICKQEFIGYPSYVDNCPSCRSARSSTNGSNLSVIDIENLRTAILQDGRHIEEESLRSAAEIISGSLLGDGSIVKGSQGNREHFAFRHKNTHKDYAQYIQNRISMAFKSNTTVMTHKAGKCVIRDKEYSCKEKYEFALSNKLVFRPVRARWYTGKVKIIPRDLRLTPLICKIWYIDDGCLAQFNSIMLYTNNFLEEDVDFLISLLREIGIEATKRFMYTKSDHLPAFAIGFCGKRVLDFLDYIGGCPVPSYSYKWDTRGYKERNAICRRCGNPFIFYGTPNSLRVKCSNCTHKSG